MSDLLDRYFESVNTENWSLMADLWNADGVLTAVGVGVVDGRDAVLEYFPRVLSGYAEHVDTPTRVIGDGDTLVVEIDFVGKLHGGTPILFTAVDVFDLVDGRISRLSTWYDSHAVIKQVKAARA
ncbi:nuclear transport factor 2 family protein [Nakamurella alba]|uniref:nuclear transport factor 2 family protein n=1 Tax=Nakamurella alba TaxID=2665158 RepID=UPI0018AAA902|nr:nuclear transport factor 2 family protein [Nakamurella alba]